MVLAQWVAVLITPNQEAGATTLFALLVPIVAAFRHRLQVGWVPHQACVASMRLDVIDHVGTSGDVLPFVMRALTVRPACELLLTHLAPPPGGVDLTVSQLELVVVLQRRVLVSQRRVSMVQPARPVPVRWPIVTQSINGAGRQRKHACI